MKVKNEVIVIESDDESTKEAQALPIPQYILELAKSGRAECKRCSQKILKSELRVGVISDSMWGLFTKWQHLHCTVFHSSITEAALIDGYFELSDEYKAEVVQRLSSSKGEVDPDRIAINPEDMVRTEWIDERGNSVVCFANAIFSYKLYCFM